MEALLEVRNAVDADLDPTIRGTRGVMAIASPVRPSDHRACCAGPPRRPSGGSGRADLYEDEENAALRARARRPSRAAPGRRTTLFTTVAAALLGPGARRPSCTAPRGRPASRPVRLHHGQDQRCGRPRISDVDPVQQNVMDRQGPGPDSPATASSGASTEGCPNELMDAYATALGHERRAPRRHRVQQLALRPAPDTGPGGALPRRRP